VKVGLFDPEYRFDGLFAKRVALAPPWRGKLFLHLLAGRRVLRFGRGLFFAEDRCEAPTVCLPFHGNEGFDSVFFQCLPI